MATAVGASALQLKASTSYSPCDCHRRRHGLRGSGGSDEAAHFLAATMPATSSRRSGRRQQQGGVRMSHYTDGAMRVGLAVPYLAVAAEDPNPTPQPARKLRMAKTAVAVNGEVDVVEEVATVASLLDLALESAPNASMTKATRKQHRIHKKRLARLVHAVKDVSLATGVPLRVRSDPRDTELERARFYAAWEREKFKCYTSWDRVSVVPCAAWDEHDDLYVHLPDRLQDGPLVSDPSWQFLVEVTNHSWEYESRRLGPIDRAQAQTTVSVRDLTSLMPTPDVVAAVAEAKRRLATNCDDSATTWRIGMLKSCYFGSETTTASCAYGLLIPEARQLALCHFPGFASLLGFLEEFNENPKVVHEIENKFCDEEGSPWLEAQLKAIRGANGEPLPWSIRLLTDGQSSRLSAPLFISPSPAGLQHHEPGIWNGWGVNGGEHWRYRLDGGRRFGLDARELRALQLVAERLGSRDPPRPVLLSEIHPD